MSIVKCLHSVLNVKALIGAFDQERVLVGAFSVITNLWWTFLKVQYDPSNWCQAASVGLS